MNNQSMYQRRCMMNNYSQNRMQRVNPINSENSENTQSPSVSISSFGNDDVEVQMMSKNANIPAKNILMKEIYQLGFAMVETMLFLDSHPSDSDALNYFQQIKMRYQEVFSMYEKYYGPLLNTCPMNENYWNWVKTPMPWELEAN